ncbi:MAG: amidase [Pseudomonadota bacterium]
MTLGGPTSYYALSAREALDRLRDGSLSSRDLVASCLERIKAFEDDVQAWAFLDPEHALHQAEARDKVRQRGQPLGSLHGLPIGIKDIIDTQDMPTECGTPLYSGRRSGRDATVVAKLREAGAVIMGKTVTTELAVYGPGKTLNPHDGERTPGGSSSGSAAAVAAFMVPAALGTQTNGSVIRPASFCGVYGFKPSFGSLSRHGILRQSQPLDQVGVMARSLEDVALIGDAIAGFDSRDPDTAPAQATLELSKRAAQDVPAPPKFAFVRTSQWQRADSATHEAFSQLTDFLGERIEPLDLPGDFDGALAAHKTVMGADLAKSFAKEYEVGKDQLTPRLCEMIEEGASFTAVAYNRARDLQETLREHLDEVFDAYDAIITPATLGEAPKGLDSTGDPSFCTTWTFAGVPALTLPLLQGENGLPVGVQLVGQYGDDGRLLRTANWLAHKVSEVQ